MFEVVLIDLRLIQGSNSTREKWWPYCELHTQQKEAYERLEPLLPRLLWQKSSIENRPVKEQSDILSL